MSAHNPDDEIHGAARGIMYGLLFEGAAMLILAAGCWGAWRIAAALLRVFAQAIY